MHETSRRFTRLEKEFGTPLQQNHAKNVGIFAALKINVNAAMVSTRQVYLTIEQLTPVLRRS
jgi:hypothetical protein